MGEDDFRAMRDQWAPIDNDARILTLEFMRNGDMHNLIKKLAKRKEAVPQPVLWRIFFCRECASSGSSTRPLLVVQASLTLKLPITISRQGLHSDVLTTEVFDTRRRNSSTSTAMDGPLWPRPRRGSGRIGSGVGPAAAGLELRTL